MFLLEKDNNPSQFVNVTSEADPVRFERDLDLVTIGLNAKRLFMETEVMQFLQYM